MSATGRRLWDKGDALDEQVQRFTVGDDPLWDRHLVRWDCLGSAAHARTLARAGLLTESEADALVAALREITRETAAGQFTIPPALEDAHTAIEAALAERCGAAGAKIHAGRSRNDQVATAMRLLMRSGLLDVLDALSEFAATAVDRLRQVGHVPLPGYTHLQPAMPSSVGQWLHAMLEAAVELHGVGLELLDRLDSCPLGTGAGYGVPLPLDRELTARLLGFSRVQRSPIDVQNSRGRYETWCVRFGADVGCILERLGADVILFSTHEFGLVRLPPAIATGSSIMPQKRNPDVFELLRAHAARTRARVVELEGLTSRLSSGYHRDLQLTKEPTIRTLIEVPDALTVAARALGRIEFDESRCAAAIGAEMFAAHAALARAQAGEPFRAAYRAVAAELAAGKFAPPQLAEWRATAGRVPAADVHALEAELRHRYEAVRAWRERLTRAEAALLA